MKAVHFFLSASCYALILFYNQTISALSSLAKNDAYPVFTSLDPHEFMLTYRKLCYKNIFWAGEKGDRFSLSVSGFGQNADRGKTIKGERTFDPETNQEIRTELGDLTGRSSMIALLYGTLPQGASYGPKLTEARERLFPNVPAGTELTNAEAIDLDQLFGFYSFGLKYRKRGARFHFMARLSEDFGLSLQTGIANICQTVTSRTYSTADKTFDCADLNNVTTENVNCLLMDQLDPIAREIGLDLCNFGATSVEEIRLNLFWRHIYACLACDPGMWPDVLIIPFVEISASFSPGKRKDPMVQFGLPFGNNGHPSGGFSAGINFDFVHTIEIGVEGGMTHFFARSFSDFRLPNSILQTTIFPFATDVKIQPGHSWHFGAKMTAFHFIDKLSLYFQYLMVEHTKDSITLKNPDPAFKLECFEDTTVFKTKLANIGFNYDLCPNLVLGVLWQMPIQQRNSYRSTTVLFTINATF